MRQFLQVLLAFFLIFNELKTQLPITLEDIWQNGRFAPRSVPGFNFQNDGVHFTKLSGSMIEQFDLRTGEKSGVIFDAAAADSKNAAGWEDKFDGYQFAADESKILLTTATEQIYRHSSKSHFFIFDSKTKSLERLHDGSKQRYATCSPDNRKVAFECNNNLYFKDLASGKTTKITSDGKPNEVIEGASDWVYEEEFVLVRAFEWSPDSRKIAWLRFDEATVPEFQMEKHTGGAYPEIEKFKYPKVGATNATVSAWIFDLASGQKMEVGRECFGAGEFYLPRIAWTPDGQLCLTWMNRHQNELRLILADAETGKCRLLFEEKNKYYIDLQDVTFLADGSGFVMQSERSGFNHLYLHDLKTGKELRPLTKGKFEVTDFYGFDKRNGRVFYQAASKNAMQREVFSADLKGKKLKKIAVAAGTNSARFSKTFDYFIHTFSAANTPPQYSVRDRDGKLVRELVKNEQLQRLQQDHAVVPMQFFDFKTSENVKLNGWMLRPDAPQFQGKKLPVLMFVYGGPGSQQVTDAWKGANYWWFQMLAQQGYVVACVDNRGTGGRGEEFKKMTYLNLGKYEAIDQIEAAKHLGTLPFVDKDRMGIFGWSYGGFMSTNCLLKGDSVFKAAIAVAPVTNWKWYDSIYTERYMRTESENPQGYAENSPVNYADKLRGHYLLVHGLADDNVHFQHAAEISNRLIAADKQFQTMIYPNRNHGIGGGNARLHLYTLMTNFLNEKLKGQSDSDLPRP